MNRAAYVFAAILLAVGQAQAADHDHKAPPGLVSITAEQQKHVGLTTVPVAYSEITEPVDVPGSIAFDQGRVALLRPLAPSRVQRLLVQPGDVVRPGQALAEFYMPSLADAQTNLAAEQAALQEALAGIAVAKDALWRGEVLAKDGSLARAEAARRRLALVQARAGAQTAQARIAALKSTIQRLGGTALPGVATLSSPIGGVVVSTGVTPGETVDTSAEALKIADLSVVLVMAQIPEASVPLIAAGAPADICLPGNERRWHGHVVALGAALDPQARSLPARIEIANGDRALRAGMNVQVVLTSDRGRRGLIVPDAAVQLIGDRNVAFTPAGDGKFQSHDVVVGVHGPYGVEIRQGLSSGDRVVTEGSFALKALLQTSLLGGAG